MTRSYRVSVFDEWLSVCWWPDRPDLPPIWSLWNCAGPSLVCLDTGRGDPPARYFSLGILPEELH
jgi:hypothetical protein